LFKVLIRSIYGVVVRGQTY